MITCEKDPRISFSTPNTCITRQFFIKEQGPTETPGMIRPNNGKIIDCSMCVGCETGLKFLNEREKMDQKKFCSKCGQTKNIDLFYKNASNKDGLQNWCKKCTNFQLAVKKHEKNPPASDPAAEKKDRPLPGVDWMFPSTPIHGNFPEVEESLAKEIPEQICTGCGKSLPATTEYYHKDGNGKLRGDCKDCRAKNRKGESRIITLDLKDVPDLVEKIATWAKQQRRIPAQQIIFHLEELLGAER